MKLILLLAFLPFITSFPFLPLLTTPPARPTALSASAERTYIMIKPDGVQRGLIGDIIKRFEDKGLTMLGCKVRMANGGLLEEHYKDLVDKVSLPSFNQVLFCSIVHFISSFFSLKKKAQPTDMPIIAKAQIIFFLNLLFFSRASFWRRASIFFLFIFILD